MRTVSNRISAAGVTSASNTRGSTLRCNGLSYRTKTEHQSGERHLSGTVPFTVSASHLKPWFESASGQRQNLNLYSYDLQPRRCHPTAVAGLTMRRDWRQPDHLRDSQIQNSRSLFWRRGRLQVRWRTASCWRNARFSRARSRWLLKPERKQVRSSQSMLGMPGLCLARVKKSTRFPR